MIFKNNNYHRLSVFIVLCIGFLVRLISIGDVPGNGAVNQDEAYGGYEAWSMLYYGHDSRGYKNFPVYIKTWGAGMNLLANLAMIPFIKFLDLTPLSIRLPHAILGCISLLIFYLLVSKIRGRDVGLVSLFILSIIPWHIMISRWGLECNFLPGFFLISTYLLVKSIDKRIYLYLSMIFFGLTFYTYAAAWAVLPFLISHLYIYIMRKNQLFNKKIFGIHTLICILILSFFAIPIVCLYLVNSQTIKEISIPFFSIPTIAMRYREVNFSFPDAIIRLKAIYNLLIVHQSDFVFQNSPSRNIGIYYQISTPFFIIGLLYDILKSFSFSKNFKLQRMIYPYSGLFLIWFFYSFILSFLIIISVNRINIIHLPIVYFIAQGIVLSVNFIKCLFEKYINIITNKLPSIRNCNYLPRNIKIEKILFASIFIIYTFLFKNFVKYYFYEYSSDFHNVYYGPMKTILKKIDTISKNRKNVKIHTDPMFFMYPVILFYTKYPTDEFVRTAKFEPQLRSIQFLEEFSNYKFSRTPHERYSEGDIYILDSNNKQHMNFILNNNLKFIIYGKYILGY